MEQVSLLDVIVVMGIAGAVLKFLDWYIIKATEAIRCQIHDIRDNILDFDKKFARIDDKIDKLLWHAAARAKEDLDEIEAQNAKEKETR